MKGYQFVVFPKHTKPSGIRSEVLVEDDPTYDDVMSAFFRGDLLSFIAYGGGLVVLKAEEVSYVVWYGAASSS